jgi:nitrous oxidase accessory protein NosD
VDQNDEGRVMKFRVLFSALLMAAIWCGGDTHAATYYVSPTGNNSSSGSLSAPWKTIGYGVGRMASGDTLILRGGTYVESVIVNKARVTIKSYPGEKPIIDGQEKLPTDIWGALISIRAADITLDGLQIYRSKAQGIGIQPGAHRARCSNLTISYCWRQGFSIAASYSFPADVILEKSEISRNERRVYYYRNPSKRPDLNYNYNPPWGANLSLVGGLRTIVRNCRIYESYNEGLGLYNNTEKALIENCEIWGNGVQVYISSSKLCTIRNNIIYGSAQWNGTNSALGSAGVWIGGETWAASPTKDYGHRVYGNHIANSRRCIWIAGQSNALARDNYIFNNIFAEALQEGNTFGVNVQVESGEGGTGNILKNNAILQTIPKIDTIGNPNRVTFSSNLWSQAPSNYSNGKGDTIIRFSLAKAFNYGAALGGSLKREDFSLTSPENSRDRGAWLTTVNMLGGAIASTKITVADAGFFHGDEKIKFSNGKIATIQSITGKTLTISPAVTVPNGAGLALFNYCSTLPNTGPWAFTSSSASTSLAPPIGLKVSF